MVTASSALCIESKVSMVQWSTTTSSSWSPLTLKPTGKDYSAQSDTYLVCM